MRSPGIDNGSRQGAKRRRKRYQHTIGGDTGGEDGQMRFVTRDGAEAVQEGDHEGGMVAHGHAGRGGVEGRWGGNISGCTPTMTRRCCTGWTKWPGNK